MSNRSKPAVGNGRLFIDIHLRQWTPGEHIVRLRDLDGNVVELDGLIHDRPHQFILIELDTSDIDKVEGGAAPIIDVPGWFTDYHPHNGHALGAQAPEYKLPDGTIVPPGKVKRVPHAARKVELHPKLGVVWKHNGQPIHPQPMTADGGPAERGRDTPAVATAPLGVHRDIVPPK